MIWNHIDLTYLMNNHIHHHRSSIAWHFNEFIFFLARSASREKHQRGRTQCLPSCQFGIIPRKCKEGTQNRIRFRHGCSYVLWIWFSHWWKKEVGLMSYRSFVTIWFDKRFWDDISNNLILIRHVEEILWVCELDYVKDTFRLIVAFDICYMHWADALLRVKSYKYM